MEKVKSVIKDTYQSIKNWAFKEKMNSIKDVIVCFIKFTFLSLIAILAVIFIPIMVICIVPVAIFLLFQGASLAIVFGCPLFLLFYLFDRYIMRRSLPIETTKHTCCCGGCTKTCS